MKYCEPNHSTIQEVDAVHSIIDWGLKHLDLFSPIDLVRKLLKVRKTRPLNVLHQSKFFDFQKPAKLYKHSLVPYSKVKQLQFRQDNAKKVWFKTSFSGDLQMATISQECTLVKSVPTLRLSVLLNVLFCPNSVAKILIYLMRKSKMSSISWSSSPTKTKSILKPRLNSTIRLRGILNVWKPLRLREIHVQRRIPLKQNGGPQRNSTKNERFWVFFLILYFFEYHCCIRTRLSYLHGEKNRQPTTFCRI